MFPEMVKLFDLDFEAELQKLLASRSASENDTTSEQLVDKK